MHHLKWYIDACNGSAKLQATKFKQVFKITEISFLKSQQQDCHVGQRSCFDAGQHFRFLCRFKPKYTKYRYACLWTLRTSAFCSVIFRSCIFRPCDLVRHCQVLHCQPLRFGHCQVLQCQVPGYSWSVSVRSSLFSRPTLICGSCKTWAWSAAALNPGLDHGQL